MRVLISVWDELRHGHRELVLDLEESAGLEPVLVSSVDVWVFDSHGHLQGCFSSSQSTSMDARTVEGGGEHSGIILQVISNRLSRSLVARISARSLLLWLIVCFAISLILERFKKTWIWFKDVRIAAVPAERHWRNTVRKSLIVVLQNSQLLQQTSCVDHALLVVWNGDGSDQSDFYEDSLFGYQASPLLAIFSLIR